MARAKASGTKKAQVRKKASHRFPTIKSPPIQRQTGAEETATQASLSKIVKAAEAEARAFLPEPPKGSSPTSWRKADMAIVKADGTRMLVPGGTLAREEPFYPDQAAARIPRDALLTPIPTDAAVRLDKYWRSFSIPKGRLPHGANIQLAINLLALCLLLRNDRDLTASQRVVIGHNIGVVRMMLRMYSDQNLLINQARHAKHYWAKRRTVALFDSLRKKYPDLPLISEQRDAKVIAISDKVVDQLESEGYGRLSVRTVNKWRRDNTPKTMRKKGRPEGT